MDSDHTVLTRAGDRSPVAARTGADAARHLLGDHRRTGTARAGEARRRDVARQLRTPKSRRPTSAGIHDLTGVVGDSEPFRPSSSASRKHRRSGRPRDRARSRIDAATDARTRWHNAPRSLAGNSFRRPESSWTAILTAPDRWPCWNSSARRTSRTVTVSRSISAASVAKSATRYVRNGVSPASFPIAPLAAPDMVYADPHEFPFSSGDLLGSSPISVNGAPHA